MTQPTLAKQFERTFFARSPVMVAPELLGAILWRQLPGGQLVGGKIVETEAYWGETDLACHARFGRTKRSETLWGPPGTAYVYLVYGMYHCLNVVTEPEGTPSAVLIRALESLSPPTLPHGRQASAGAPLSVPTDIRSMSGPGKLCRALDITKVHNRIDLLVGDELWLEPGMPPKGIVTSPRIGVDYAGEEWAKNPWRFIDAGSSFVSGKR